MVASCFWQDKLLVTSATMLLMLAATKQTGIRNGGRNVRHVLANVSNLRTAFSDVGLPVRRISRSSSHQTQQ